MYTRVDRPTEYEMPMTFLIDLGKRGKAKKEGIGKSWYFFTKTHQGVRNDDKRKLY